MTTWVLPHQLGKQECESLSEPHFQCCGVWVNQGGSAASGGVCQCCEVPELTRPHVALSGGVAGIYR